MLNLCKPGAGFTKFIDVPQVLSQNKHQGHCIVRKHNLKRYPTVASLGCLFNFGSCSCGVGTLLFFISIQLYNNYVEINLHYFEVVQGGLLRCRLTERVCRH